MSNIFCDLKIQFILVFLRVKGVCACMCACVCTCTSKSIVCPTVPAKHLEKIGFEGDKSLLT